jgi:ribA/ribD-fused uncharacterized protein
MLFRDRYYFLSNFYRAPFVLNNRLYRSVEVFYQASKATNEEDHEMLRQHPDKGLKRAARNIQLRADWEKAKYNIMWTGLWYKFHSHPDLMDRLVAIEEPIVEHNYWHDNYWGSCLCQKCGDRGQNVLGRLLAEIRRLELLKRRR